MNQEIIELSSSDEDVVVVDHGRTYYAEIFGKPAAMPRPTFMAWMKNNKLSRRVVNGASGKQTEFRNAWKHHMINHNNVDNNQFPLFPEGGVKMTLKFHRRLPNKAFKSDTRGRGLKNTDWKINGTVFDFMKPDIDNLAKFVLDALNGAAYTDDDQVVSLELIKVVDLQPPNHEGRTEVWISSLRNVYADTNVANVDV